MPNERVALPIFPCLAQGYPHEGCWMPSQDPHF